MAKGQGSLRSTYLGQRVGNPFDIDTDHTFHIIEEFRWLAKERELIFLEFLVH